MDIKWDGRKRTGFKWLSMRPDPLHHGGDLSDSIKKEVHCVTNWATISFSTTRLHTAR